MPATRSAVRREAQVEASGDSLSARANAALRDDVERRRRRQALGALLDRLAAERGPLDTSEDESEIRRYMRLLGGPEDVGRGGEDHQPSTVGPARSR